MEDKKRQEEIRKKIDQADSPADIISALDELHIFSDSPDERLRTDGLLGKMAFEALKNLTAEDPLRARALILGHLLPICIQDSTINETRYNLSIARECLASWINQYSESDLKTIRNTILDKLLESFSKQNPRGAFFTLSAIGFRRADIVEALWKKVEERNDEIGDAALSTLVFLGVAGKDRERALNEIHCRMDQRYNLSLASTLHRLADRQSLEPILKSWFLTKKLIKNHLDAISSIQLFSNIADAGADDVNLQDEAWDAILKALNAYSKEIEPISALSFWSAIASRCDTPDVVHYLLRSLESESGKLDTLARRRYLIQERLRDCVRPRQQNAWIGDLNKSLVDVLRAEACLDTKEKGPFKTDSIMRKEIAWKTLLRLGCSDVLGWIESAVVKETNAFVRRNICNYLACFRLDSLPQSFITWITEECDLRKQEPEKWLFRLGAIDVMRSSASSQAFAALLNFGVTIEGNAPTKVADALSSTAIVLNNLDDQEIPSKLIQKLRKGKKNHHQTAAAAALEALARQTTLPHRFIPDLEECLADLKREKYQRAVIASIFGFLPKENISTKALKCLTELSKEENDWIASRALEPLARHDCLIPYEDLLISKLGLKKVGDRWDLSSETNSKKWSPYFIAWLHRYHPQEFFPAIKTILLNHQWPSVVQVLAFWESELNRSLQIAEEIQDVLVKRAIQGQKASYSEKDIFHYLAIFMPEKLALTNWEECWREWLPEARQALAEALGETQHKTVPGKSRAFKLLIKLTEDGLYAVRRSAYRSMSVNSPEALWAWVESLSGSDSPDESRKRASEACGWLPEQGEFRDKYEELHGLLIHDPELSVRETMAKTHKDRRNRLWGKAYLKEVLSINGLTNEEIFNAWRYGEALLKLGDDDCMQKLRERIRKPGLPPNLTFWLNEICQELDKNWRKTIRDWPQPWITYKGKVVEGQGMLIYSSGKEIPVRYTIWHKPAQDPSQFDDWNGLAFPINEHFFDLNIKELQLRLESGDTGKVLITSNHLKWIVFTNQGRFPK